LATALALVLAACASDRPPSSAAGGAAERPHGGATSVMTTALPAAAVSPAAVEAELSRLRAAFAREAPRATTRVPEREQDRIARARAAVAASGQAVEVPQLLVVVDRSPAVQEMSLVLAHPSAPWEVVGSAKVSTGQAGRRDHYLTPAGVFPHTDAILDWRAEGTFNANRIRGLGRRGMRVWDFGWQWAPKAWRADHEPGEIRLLLHATDPDHLEARLGRAASKGCVRIPEAVNRYLDRHGVLDADYERVAVDDRRFRALLLPDREPTPLAGRMLVVVDSSAVAFPRLRPGRRPARTAAARGRPPRAGRARRCRPGLR